jgi:hypothetical protein
VGVSNTPCFGFFLIVCKNTKQKGLPYLPFPIFSYQFVNPKAMTPGKIPMIPRTILSGNRRQSITFAGKTYLDDGIKHLIWNGWRVQAGSGSLIDQGRTAISHCD